MAKEADIIIFEATSPEFIAVIACVDVKRPIDLQALDGPLPEWHLKNAIVVCVGKLVILVAEAMKPATFGAMNATNALLNVCPDARFFFKIGGCSCECDLKKGTVVILDKDVEAGEEDRVIRDLYTKSTVNKEDANFPGMAPINFPYKFGIVDLKRAKQR